MKRLALLLALLAGPAGAQTMAEAAAANAGLAMRLCLQNMDSPDALYAAFRAAGFREELEGFEDDVTIHWFSDPAGTILVNVQADVGPTFCAVNNDHMGVSQAIAFAGAVIEGVYPGLFQPGRAESTGPAVVPGSPAAGTESCTGYVGFAPRRVMEVTVGIAGQDPVCVENGTSQIMLNL